MVKLVIPSVVGRGAGLGNELVSWGKAYIAGQVLGIPAFPPAWSLNKRGYRYYFGSSYVDWPRNEILKKILPLYKLTEADYLSEPSKDLSKAIVNFAEKNRLGEKHNYIFEISGMWGGLECIAKAKSFLYAQLLNARHSTENLYAFEKKISADPIRVGFHLRRGDFSSPAVGEDFKNKFNIAIPMEWYIGIARTLKKRLSSNVVFVISSDATADELQPFLQEFDNCLFPEDEHRDISDMLILSNCDLIVCSVSSYSMFAVFFSKARYIWFKPNLTKNSGFWSIWGSEDTQQLDGSPTITATNLVATLDPQQQSTGRGVPVGWDGHVPDELIADLTNRNTSLRRETDLLRYGVLGLQTELGHSN
jgi:hypothetical protein